jgi:hypothetical protein
MGEKYEPFTPEPCRPAAEKRHEFEPSKANAFIA